MNEVTEYSQPPVIVDWTGRDVYPPDDGAYANVDEELYHGDDTRMSKHQLGEVLRSIAHWHASKHAARKPSDAMRWGLALHCGMEGWQAFLSKYSMGPDAARSTKAWKTAELEADGKILLKPAEWDSVTGAMQSVLTHRIAGAFAKSPMLHRELTINFRYGDIPLRSRLDAYESISGTIIDWKRTEDARASAFRRAVDSFGYHMQDFMYRTACQAVGLPVARFLFVCVEPKPPYAVAVYELADWWVYGHRADPREPKSGEQLAIESLEKWRAHIAQIGPNKPNAFESYPDAGIFVIEPPKWHKDPWDGVLGVAEK